jgi:L-histidine N-alpha-methyltransferase
VSITIDVLLQPEDIQRALRSDVTRGLTSEPKTLPPKWFYDDRGCELFDAITRLPEYYPTETERAILRAQADSIARDAGADTIVELGSGTSDKTRTLLDAFSRTGQLRRFAALEVNEATLRDAAEAIHHAYPAIDVHGVVGDFEHHLPHLPAGGRRMITFLGSTIGNFAPAERKRFLADVADAMVPGDSLLLGTDLVKRVDRLEAAYDDAQGVTAEFNLNVLRVINRELGADFDLGAFTHLARFDAGAEWIEMLLRSERAQQVTVRALDLTIDFAEGELMRTEISAKFRAEGVAAELGEAGLRVVQWMTDAHEDFAVSLAVREG